MSVTRCYACQCEDKRLTPDVAFLAGMAFVAQHNVDAIRARLCVRHAGMLSGGFMAAYGAVPVTDRR